MLCHKSLSHLGVYNSGVVERLVVLGVLQEKISHDEAACHLDEAACHEVEILGVVGFGDFSNGFLVCYGEVAENSGQRSELGIKNKGWPTR